MGTCQRAEGGSCDDVACLNGCKLLAADDADAMRARHEQYVDGPKREPIAALPITIQRDVRPNAEILMTPELFNVLLDLPAEYKFMSTRRDGYYQLTLRIDHLPDVSMLAPLHQIVPEYERVETGKTVLKGVRVIPSADRQRRG